MKKITKSVSKLNLGKIRISVLTQKEMINVNSGGPSKTVLSGTCVTCGSGVDNSCGTVVCGGL